MKIIEGNVLPLGVSRKENVLNFAVEVLKGGVCTLELYDIIGKLVQSVEMKKIRTNCSVFCVGIQNIDSSIVSYNYAIENEKFLDPYVKEVLGRHSYGNEKKETHNAIIYMISPIMNFLFVLIDMVKISFDVLFIKYQISLAFSIFLSLRFLSTNTVFVTHNARLKTTPGNVR